MLKLKTPLISAGAACLLSMIIGMISGVHISNVIVRGIVTGIVLGSFTALLLFLWYKFTPDTDTQQSDSYSHTVGENVNITIDDAEAVPSFPNTEEQGSSTSTAFVNAANTFSGAAAEPVDTKSTGTAVSGTQDGVSEENTEDAIPQEDIGELPSMDAFMPEDTSVPDTASYDSNGEQGTTSGFSVSEIQTTDADTKVMAQAIRTILQSGE
ncbi:MAG: hypothetical protein ACTTH7_08140 [Treponema sp.]